MFLSLFLILLDQLIKQLVIFFSLPFIKNYGVSFGLFSEITSKYIIIVVLVVNIVLIKIIKEKKYEYINRSLIMILSGGLSNLIDRIFRGYIIDYISFKNFPVFNFADLLINLGIIYLIYEFINKNYLRRS